MAEGNDPDQNQDNSPKLTPAGRKPRSQAATSTENKPPRIETNQAEQAAANQAASPPPDRAAPAEHQAGQPPAGKGRGKKPFDLRSYLQSRFVIDNVFRAAIAIILGIGGYVGNKQFNSLKTSADTQVSQLTEQMQQLNTLACSFASDAVTHALDDIETTLIGVSIDDIQPEADFPSKRFDQLLHTYDHQLALCDDGKRVKARVDSLNAWITSYTRKQYDKAVTSLTAIASPSSVEEAWIGAALSYQADQQTDPARKKQLSIDAANHVDTSVRLLSSELPNNNKSHILLKLKCNSFMIRSRDSKIYATETERCLHQLIDDNFDDYNVEYNLAVIYIREGQFSDALSATKKCLELNKGHFIHKNDFDDDFKAMLSDAEFGPKLQLLVEQFPP